MSRVRGFPYWCGDDAKKMQYILEICTRLCEKMGCELVFVPVVEELKLFTRTIGESDVVHKEMFVFEDSHKQVCLRPELTSGIISALSECDKLSGRYMTYGPNFRRERPQKGRFRQFVQFDVEILGEKNVMAEYDILLFVKDFINHLSLKNTELQINTIGTATERQEFSQVLKAFFHTNYEHLSSVSKERYDRGNFLRILDSKDDEELLKITPKFVDYLSEKTLQRFELIKNFAMNIGLNVVINPLLVRGLDYYHDFVFELVALDFPGSQCTILGGGRFDGLCEYMGYTPRAAVGFALGVERIAELIQLPDNIKENVGLISLYPEYLEKVRSQFVDLYNMQLLSDNISDGLKLAHKYKLHKVIIIADEIKNGEIIMKNMLTGEQHTICFII